MNTDATTFLLIRHGSHDLLGKALAGRSAVPLNTKGQGEAERLAERLTRTSVQACICSPVLRTQQTAICIAAKHDLGVQTHAGINEIDFGEWTEQTFQELESDPLWHVWVNRRSDACPPDGEKLVAVQHRAVAAVQEISAAHANVTIALVSHGDVIKAILAHFLGISLDHLERFEVAPGSISVLIFGRDWSRVACVNDTGHLQ